MYMTPTRRRRLYKRALQILNEHHSNYAWMTNDYPLMGMCVALEDAHCELWFDEMFWFHNLNEFNLLKPKNKGKKDYWWKGGPEGFMIRVMAFEHMIEQTYNAER